MATMHKIELDRMQFESNLDVRFTVLNLASTAAALILPFWYTSRASVIAFLIVYSICGLGLTAGYHRLFAHRSYVVPKWLERTLAICGYLAIQRGPIFWVSMHRLHHRYSDVPRYDPHTPNEGIWHVHFGWIQRRRKDVWDARIYHRWSRDLLSDPLYVWMDSEAHDYATSFILAGVAWLAGGLSQPGLPYFGFAHFDFHSAMCMFVWVGLLNRVALVQAFGLINSVCHIWGTRRFNTSGADQSRNNLLVAMIIFGEGWHNNHHAFPRSARQGLRWYQPDIAWYLIWVLKMLGLAKNVRVPSSAAEDLRELRTENLSATLHEVP